MNKLIKIFLLGILSMSIQLSMSQDSFNRGISKKISILKFNSIIDESIQLLETKKLDEISDSQHINIMMCLNTILKNNFGEDHKIQNRNTTMFLNSLPQKINKGTRYDHLKSLCKQKRYSLEIIKIYSDWVPNRGMGYYFKKLNMELYGTPMPYALFEIEK